MSNIHKQYLVARDNLQGNLIIHKSSLIQKNTMPNVVVSCSCGNSDRNHMINTELNKHIHLFIDWFLEQNILDY